MIERASWGRPRRAERDQPGRLPRGSRASLALLALVAAGCSSSTSSADGSSTWQGGTAGVDATSGSAAERFFPLKDGTLYHYKTEALKEGPVQAGVLMMKVHRTSATRGELRKPAGTQVFEFSSLGIATQTKTGAPAFLLKLPIDPNTTWLGPQGGKTRISASDVSITTPAGSFAGCLTTLEERGGDSPFRVQTTLCPDVGIVALEAQSGGAVERAELVYYGPPIDIGEEGLRRVP
ncbi:MAG: hypothetical protein HOW73_34985 [Polyangiaceae bacterium]|nr:hypothetical protein [Polyangiaceae bacterium]